MLAYAAFAGKDWTQTKFNKRIKKVSVGKLFIIINSIIVKK